MFKCSPVNFPVKRENYCFPYFYMRIFPRLCGITFIIIFARNFKENLVQNFNFIFFIKFCILENNFVFYVSCINFKFPWKKCVFKFIYNSFYKSKTLCVPVLKITYFKSDRECMFILEIFRESKPSLSWPLARSWLGREFFNPYVLKRFPDQNHIWSIARSW